MMKTNNITHCGLGKTASLLLTTLAGQGKGIFTARDARRILGGSPGATYKLLHDLVRSRWLHSLGKGRYLIIPIEAGPERRYTAHEFLIAHHLAPEGYIAYWSALHHRGLTEQIPRSVWVATSRRRRTQILAGVLYRFVTLHPHKVFGQESVWIEGKAVAVADLEKSLVDALDHPEHCGGMEEVAKALKTALTEQRPDLNRLTHYGFQMRNRTIFKRLGFLAERLGLPVQDFTEQWHAELSAGYGRLDPSQPPAGPYHRRWRLQINVRDVDLAGSQER